MVIQRSAYNISWAAAQWKKFTVGVSQPLTIFTAALCTPADLPVTPRIEQDTYAAFVLGITSVFRVPLEKKVSRISVLDLPYVVDEINTREMISYDLAGRFRAGRTRYVFESLVNTLYGENRILSPAATPYFYPVYFTSYLVGGLIRKDRITITFGI